MTQLDLEKGFQEIWKLFAETDRKIERMLKESDERLKDTDRKFKDLAKSREETDRIFKELAESNKTTDKKIENLIGKWGKFVEGLIIPAAKKMFRERGIYIEHVSRQAEVSRNGKEGIEIDVLSINGEYAVLIEAKSTLGVDDVDEHIERIKKFRHFFPEYVNRKVIGAVAGIVIEENADKYAYKQGLFVIAQSGDSVKILNDRKFKPKEW